MDPSDVVDFGIFIGEENCPVGTVQCQKGCTYADIHFESVDDEICEYPFDFTGPIGIPINTNQEKKRKPTTTNVGIKRKVGTLVVETLQSQVWKERQSLKQPRVDHVSESVEQVVLADPNVLES